MNQSRVRHSDIEVGKPLPWDVFDEKGTLLLRKGYVVASENQIDRLVAVGVFAESTALRESRLAQVEIEAVASSPSTPKEMWLDLRKRMDQIYEGLDALIKSGQFIQSILAIAREVDLLCTGKPELAQAMISLNQEGRYSTRHMLDTAIVVRLVGRALKLSAPKEAGLICAALTMNIGSNNFQDEIQTLSGTLTNEQRARLHNHPEEATALLKLIGVNDPVWLRSVLEHHELLDGSGYPHKLSGHELSTEGQILRLADVYCARVTYREYRAAVPLTVALRDILQERNKSVDGTLAAKFISTVGIFPPGLQLRLANGEKGVVMRAGSSANHPIVMSLIDADGRPLNPGTVRDTVIPEFTPRETIDPTTFKAYVDIDAIWG